MCSETVRPFPAAGCAEAAVGAGARVKVPVPGASSRELALRSCARTDLQRPAILLAAFHERALRAKQKLPQGVNLILGVMREVYVRMGAFLWVLFPGCFFQGAFSRVLFLGCFFWVL